MGANEDPAPPYTPEPAPPREDLEHWLRDLRTEAGANPADWAEAEGDHPAAEPPVWTPSDHTPPDPPPTRTPPVAAPPVRTPPVAAPPVRTPPVVAPPARVEESRGGGRHRAPD